MDRKTRRLLEAPASYSLADSMIEDLQAKLEETFLHGSVTSTVCEEPSSFSMDDMNEAIRKAREICDRQPKQIVVVPQEMMGADQDRYDLVFGKGSLVISEGEYARLEDECRKNFMDDQLDPSASPPVVGALTGFHGLPVKFVRGVPAKNGETAK